MHAIMGELLGKGALVLHGEQEFEYHRPIEVGDVLDGEGRIIDIYEKDTDTATMTFVVMETRVDGRRVRRAGGHRAVQPDRPAEEVAARNRTRRMEHAHGSAEDKVAIITGAGQGIGLAYAERFLAEGAKVVVAEINEERAASAMKQLEGKGDVVSVRTDISDEQSALDCAAATDRRVRHDRHPASTTRRSTTTSTTTGTTTSTCRRCSR